MASENETVYAMSLNKVMTIADSTLAKAAGESEVKE